MPKIPVYFQRLGPVGQDREEEEEEDLPALGQPSLAYQSGGYR